MGFTSAHPIDVQTSSLVYSNITIYGEYMTRIWYEQKNCYTKLSNTKMVRTKLMRIMVQASHVLVTTHPELQKWDLESKNKAQDLC